MELTEYLNQALDLARQGFDTVNTIQAVVIALIAAFVMSRYTRILVVAAGATIIHELVNIGRVAYAARGEGDVAGKALELLTGYVDIDVLQLVAIRFVGFLVVISLIYFVRRILFRG
ncbi:hypothetical protein [uncultured Parvibaculum sp.]|uniref:hypothetical protein n=1 Tax=uncultured Parvibaculum sp. TaxID=291828 RepID=UPI0030DB1C1F|tara:strand:+ start:103058 stop:103408 length:351 start_codon:yes stop_codon:yes gene_type:complete